MFVLLAATSLVASELAVASVPGPDIIIEEQKPAAYSELVQGHYGEAVAALEAALIKDPADPALLINLAYAYAHQGRLDKAANAYRAAVSSPTRYELELATGRWDDSRVVAQSAMRAIEAKVQIAALTP